MEKRHTVSLWPWDWNIPRLCLLRYSYCLFTLIRDHIHREKLGKEEEDICEKLSVVMVK